MANTLRHLTRPPHTAAPRFSELGRKAPWEAMSQSPIHGEVSNIDGCELGRLDTQVPSQTPPSNYDMIANTSQAELPVVYVFQTQPASTPEILDTDISTQVPNSRGRRFSDMTTQEPASPRERRHDLSVSGFDDRDGALRFG